MRVACRGSVPGTSTGLRSSKNFLGVAVLVVLQNPRHSQQPGARCMAAQGRAGPAEGAAEREACVHGGGGGAEAPPLQSTRRSLQRMLGARSVGQVGCAAGQRLRRGAPQQSPDASRPSISVRGLEVSPGGAALAGRSTRGTSRLRWGKGMKVAAGGEDIWGGEGWRRSEKGAA